MNSKSIVLFGFITLSFCSVGFASDTPLPVFDTCQTAQQAIAKLEQFWLQSGYPKMFDSNMVYVPGFKNQLLAKARPDECFIGIGQDNVFPFNFNTQCNGRAKVNQSYVFGLAKSGNYMWIGTSPNMLCLVISTIAAQVPGFELPAMQNRCWVCEFGQSKFGQANNLPAALGDWRPPQILRYNINTKQLQNMTPNDPLINQTLGLRSAGAIGNLVILAGPTLTGMGGPSQTAGINLFAFRADTGQFLGSKQILQFNDIRKWVIAGSRIYTGVLNNRQYSTYSGSVLQWEGTVSNPFKYKIVGSLDGEGVELACHNSRIFVTTWPDFTTYPVIRPAGLFMGPKLTTCGLPESTSMWQKVWSASDFEPDPVTAMMYNGGALASFGGYVYWGTMMAPLTAGLAHVQAYNITDANQIIAAVIGAHRPCCIFRGKDFGTANQKLEVLYGLPLFPVYENVSTDSQVPQFKWVLKKGPMGTPRQGLAGFGNIFNAYAWTMAVYDNKLFVGTFDWGFVGEEFIRMLAEPYVQYLPDFKMLEPFYGADLWCFSSALKPAKPVSLNGAGNYSNYGIRTMVSAKEGLYLGTANPMNLLTDKTDDLPEGGWELRRLSLIPTN